MNREQDQARSTLLPPPATQPAGGNGASHKRPAGQRLLPLRRLEKVQAWGGALHSFGYVYRPNTIDRIRDVLRLAAESSCSLGLRGAGNSYGDAAMNGEQIVLDMRRMDRILDWNPATGLVRVEPGVTLERLWRYGLEDGWWPPVATGTMKVSMGGAAAMNVHGKNAWQAGTFGDHIVEFDLLLASGELVTCSRTQNSDLFWSAIGSAGALGCFTSLTIQLKRVHSGLLTVETGTVPNLQAMFDYFESNVDEADYIVGWIDAFAGGRALGRGDVHRANYLPPGADPDPGRTLQPSYQDLPGAILGLLPRSEVWRFQRPFWNNVGMRYVNLAKYWAARLNRRTQYRQPHAQFHFLLDYFDWRKPFGPGGLIQYQPFVPRHKAPETFAQLLRLCQEQRLPNYLTVLKRHRADDFLISYGLDGYSLAMDFRITRGNRRRVLELTRHMDEIVLAAGGRFYLAKDSTLRPDVAAAYLGRSAWRRFAELKSRYDPDLRMQTDLWRRLFA